MAIRPAVASSGNSLLPGHGIGADTGHTPDWATRTRRRDHEWLLLSIQTGPGTHRSKVFSVSPSNRSSLT